MMAFLWFSCNFDMVWEDVSTTFTCATILTRSHHSHFLQIGVEEGKWNNLSKLDD